MVNEARVFARPLNPDEAGFVGVEDDGMAKVDWTGEMLDEASDWKECDRDTIGMVRVFGLLSESFTLDPVDGNRLVWSSAGISSGAGICRPLAAATS